MCAVSAIGDMFRDKYRYRFPQASYTNVTREEFEALKKEMEEIKELLKAAKKFDEKTGQPDCEMDDKIDFMRRWTKMRFGRYI